MGPPAKECRQLLEAERGKGIDSPLKLPEGTPPCPHVDFSPMKLTSKF